MPYESLVRNMDKKRRRRSKGDKRAKARYSRYRRGGRKGTRGHKLKAESMDSRYRRTIMHDIGRELFSWQGGRQGLATALEQAQRKLGSALSFSYVTELGERFYQVEFRDGSTIIFQENTLGAGRPYLFRVKNAENWGGDPKGPLAKALAKARKKAKEPKKPLKITSLDAESFATEGICGNCGWPYKLHPRAKGFGALSRICECKNAESFEDNEYIYDDGRLTAGGRKLAHRIIKHLSQYSPERIIREWDMPMEISQPGLVKYLMTARTRLTPILLMLEDNGFIKSTTKRVVGERRKRKVYYLTPKGFNSLGEESWYGAEDFATEWDTDWDALMCAPRDHDWEMQFIEIGPSHDTAFTRLRCSQCNLELYLQTLSPNALERCDFCGAPNGLAPCGNNADWCQLDPNPENPYNEESRNLSSETIEEITPPYRSKCPNCMGDMRQPGCTHHGAHPLMIFRTEFDSHSFALDGDGIVEPWEIESHEHQENALNALGHTDVHLADWHSRKLTPSEIKEQVINIFKNHPTVPYLTLSALANQLNEGVGKYHQTNTSRISRIIGTRRGGIGPFYVTTDGKIYFIGDEDRATFIKGVL